METVILDDPAALGRVAADAVVALLERRPDAVLGLATGSSPLPVYEELVRRHEAGKVSFARARAFTLDEYVGLPEDHPERYRTVIEREFTSRVDLRADALHSPDGTAEDIPAACAAYEDAILAAGGVDLQILGIGSDGHIAFNEPGSSLASRTRIKTLTRQTRSDNARFFDSIEQVPTHCVTQGLGTIMDSRVAVLVASGERKAEAVAAMVEGPVAARFPASILQFHPRAIVIVDEAAASKLEHIDYFRHVQEQVEAGGYPAD